jgi:hypothetical protein
MSGGLIAPLWWRERAIPFLRQRLDDLRSDDTPSS